MTVRFSTSVQSSRERNVVITGGAGGSPPMVWTVGRFLCDLTVIWGMTVGGTVAAWVALTWLETILR